VVQKIVILLHKAKKIIKSKMDYTNMTKANAVLLNRMKSRKNNEKKLKMLILCGHRNVFLHPIRIFPNFLDPFITV